MTPKEMLDALSVLTNENPGQVRLTVLDEVRALLRRDWDARVLDAWAAVCDGNGHETRHRTSGAITCWTVACYPMTGTMVGYLPTPDAARRAAALALFPTLPEAVRAELGECP